MGAKTALRVRRAGRHEAGTAAEILLRSRRASVPAIPPLVHAEDDAKEHFSEIIRQSADVWVVEADDAIAGVMVLNGNWVDQLYIDPDWTGQGLGSALIERAKTERPEGLELWTFESNVGAQRFYERHGFIAVGRTSGDNEEGAPDIHYRWASP
jgi:GNAT superfamily N-acetyltransferase